MNTPTSYTFGEIVARIITACYLAQSTLRAHYVDSTGFSIFDNKKNGCRPAIEACYNKMFEFDT